MPVIAIASLIFEHAGVDVAQPFQLIGVSLAGCVLDTNVS